MENFFAKKKIHKTIGRLRFGFTLVEMIIVIAIFILVSFSVFEIYIFGQKFYQQQSDKAELLQNGRIILERLSREIRQAEEIVTTLPLAYGSNLPNEVEFQDGHFPSPYQSLCSEYYYIRYYLATSTNEFRRQYLVYCFDDCSTCSDYFRWNDTKIVGGDTTSTHPCLLEDRIIGEYVDKIEFWKDGPINVIITLKKAGSQLKLRTKIFGRNF
ncbi:prepilin-type N-terminal cleavage/methylation domain-containing protein [bacterium]|nr:prepilin-type N-terminal cleavage/methylation domain-containing protein [bacterium]